MKRTKLKEKKDTSKGPLFFINKSISLPPEFSLEILQLQGYHFKIYILSARILVFMFSCWNQHILNFKKI